MVINMICMHALVGIKTFNQSKLAFISPTPTKLPHLLYSYFFAIQVEILSLYLSFSLQQTAMVILSFGVVTSCMYLVVDGACIALNLVRYLDTVRWMIRTKTVTADFDATINHQGA